MKHQNLLILIIVVQATLHFVNTFSYENKDLYTSNLNRSRFFLTDVFKNNVSKSTQYKRDIWDRYGMINMLWSFPSKKFRRTEMSTRNYYLRPSFRTKSTSSTSSFIEFYYLDETNMPIKKDVHIRQPFYDERPQQFRNHRNMRREARSDYTIFAFLINDPNYKRLPLHTNDFKVTESQTAKTSLHNFLSLQNHNDNVLLNKIKRNNVTVNSTTVNIETRPPAMESFVTFNHDTTQEYPITIKDTLTSNSSNLTTAYDKIKFFEMYDNNTPLPHYDDTSEINNLEDVIVDNTFNDTKITLENVDESATNNSIPQKYNITKNVYKRERKDLNSRKNVNVLHPVRFFSATTNNAAGRSVINPLPSVSNVTKFVRDNKTKEAMWAEYSFMAVYIHEPSQVLCDAAGISPHWLVTSGSCLSKHHNNPGGGGRSAFVAYCTSSWWNAERVTYVKYSVVHPRYNAKYTHRRNMYNIGLIQVVISMATCTSWSPVALISHKFTTHPVEFKAYTVGWGVDRYNTEYTVAEPPRHPLEVYESKVFLGSCSQKFSYSNTNNINEEEDKQNLYCLFSLPESDEATANMHGSMLLIEGKLCGIYLQEHRLPIGVQIAQYTGTWHLSTWVSNVAREPVDTKVLEIL